MLRPLIFLLATNHEHLQVWQISTIESACVLLAQVRRPLLKSCVLHWIRPNLDPAGKTLKARGAFLKLDKRKSDEAQAKNPGQ